MAARAPFENCYSGVEIATISGLPLCVTISLATPLVAVPQPPDILTPVVVPFFCPCLPTASGFGAVSLVDMSVSGAPSAILTLTPVSGDCCEPGYNASIALRLPCIGFTVSAVATTNIGTLSVIPVVSGCALRFDVALALPPIFSCIAFTVSGVGATNIGSLQVTPVVSGCLLQFNVNLSLPTTYSCIPFDFTTSTILTSGAGVFTATPSVSGCELHLRLSLSLPSLTCVGFSLALGATVSTLSAAATPTIAFTGAAAASGCLVNLAIHLAIPIFSTPPCIDFSLALQGSVGILEPDAEPTLSLVGGVNTETCVLSLLVHLALPSTPCIDFSLALGATVSTLSAAASPTLSLTGGVNVSGCTLSIAVHLALPSVPCIDFSTAFDATISTISATATPTISLTGGVNVSGCLLSIALHIALPSVPCIDFAVAAAATVSVVSGATPTISLGANVDAEGCNISLALHLLLPTVQCIGFTISGAGDSNVGSLTLVPTISGCHIALVATLSLPGSITDPPCIDFAVGTTASTNLGTLSLTHSTDPEGCTIDLAARLNLPCMPFTIEGGSGTARGPVVFEGTADNNGPTVFYLSDAADMSPVADFYVGMFLEDAAGEMQGIIASSGNMVTIGSGFAIPVGINDQLRIRRAGGSTSLSVVRDEGNCKYTLKAHVSMPPEPVTNCIEFVVTSAVNGTLPAGLITYSTTLKVSGCELVFTKDLSAAETTQVFVISVAFVDGEGLKVWKREARGVFVVSEEITSAVIIGTASCAEA